MKSFASLVASYQASLFVCVAELYAKAPPLYVVNATPFLPSIRQKWYGPTATPALFAPDILVAKRVSMKLTPSVAFKKANSYPPAFADAQLTAPSPE